MDHSRTRKTDALVSYGLYPLLLGASLLYAGFELAQPKEQLGKFYGLYLAMLVLTMVAVETLRPMRREWKMTRSSLLGRDLPYLLIGSATLGVANFAAGWTILHFGLERGQFHGALPLVPSIVLALIIPDFLWYWVHRLSHEARGPIGRWLWRVHVAHHLPQQLYVLMHVVANPLNTIAVRIILTAPLFLLGFSTEAMFVANLIVGLQGVVSHFNVDMRVGWLNYVLVGNELHRYHHSTDISEAKNYGAVVPLWDIVFGTFVYRPGVAPRRLGVEDPTAYPAEREILRVLALPFVPPRRDRHSHDGCKSAAAGSACAAADPDGSAACRMGGGESGI
jgi:sterol desaturase/sphingolipid hydroxylase (fatty acid hydroxylase superfamily)